MIEHAAGIHWLADSNEKALTSLFRGQKNSAEKLRKAMDGDYWKSAAELDKLIEAELPDSSDDYLLHGGPLVEKYGSRRLKVGWLFESGPSHASATTVEAYLATTEDGRLSFRTEPNSSYVVDSNVLVAATVLAASDGFNSLLDGEPWTAGIEALRSELGQQVSIP